jgi:hypothetical protein
MPSIHGVVNRLRFILALLRVRKGTRQACVTVALIDIARCSSIDGCPIDVAATGEVSCYTPLSGVALGGRGVGNSDFGQLHPGSQRKLVKVWRTQRAQFSGFPVASAPGPVTGRQPRPTMPKNKGTSC